MNEQTLLVAVVEWIDSAILPADEWFDEGDESLTPVRVVSAGFVVRDDKDQMALAIDHSPDVEDGSLYRGVIVIPREVIVKVTELGSVDWMPLPDEEDDEE